MTDLQAYVDKSMDATYTIDAHCCDYIRQVYKAVYDIDLPPKPMTSDKKNLIIASQHFFSLGYEVAELMEGEIVCVKPGEYIRHLGVYCGGYVYHLLPNALGVAKWSLATFNHKYRRVIFWSYWRQDEW